MQKHSACKELIDEPMQPCRISHNETIGYDWDFAQTQIENTPGRRHQNCSLKSTNAEQNRWKRCFKLPLSPVRRRMAIENSVSNYF